MSESKGHIDYSELIARYLSGNASDQEVQTLEQWVLYDDANKREFLSAKKAWMLSDLHRKNPRLDLEQQWQHTAAQAFGSARTVPLHRRRGFMLRVAAALVLLLAASVSIVVLMNRSELMKFASLDEVEKALLPDSSRIALNQFANVSYALSDEKTRRVDLQGDAFFEVERDVARPFVITTSDIEIEVLGTAFYVDARADQPQIQVMVQSGSVALRSRKDEIVLQAGEMGIYEKASRKLYRKKNDDVNYMAWETGVLIFENTSLERVLFDLERKFHVPFSLADEQLKNCEITATLENKSLEAVVSIVEKTLNIRATKTGGAVEFSGKSCE